MRVTSSIAGQHYGGLGIYLNTPQAGCCPYVTEDAEVQTDDSDRLGTGYELCRFINPLDVAPHAGGKD